ncbi:hypothetical protein TCCBUS3UF1_p90 (plasmid) [Thermus sp. CCB_US3_UF1]|uniref:hypothetical protein n=1 Tax=unclassified Thermus TaxID=2619321 RepID=UPI00023893F6|nr:MULTISPECIES: hypothetical protein [unclassified Thermus]AEV17306.1 hypothetical protein TCCBUS3UF1_p90 [Thermus sp. CCB_US3_UF1]MCS6868164.1 hypothetical protein [Thermus sp.]MDW8358777.1 hypothetical protein [Thermus sp.]
MGEAELRRKVAELEGRVRGLEAERQKLLARLAYLEASGRRSRGRLSREQVLELHALLSEVWMELNATCPRLVPELDRALRLLEEVLGG